MIKTHLISYTFNLNNQDDKAAWEALCKRLKNGSTEYGPAHRGLMESWSGNGKSHCFTCVHDGMQEPKEVWLETNFLYSNQWNTTTDSPNYQNFRVFDWALDATGGNMLPKTIKRGHFLIITPEMKQIRDETYVCGYCGHKYPKHDTNTQEFCNHCLASEYLKQEDLRLLRLRPVSAGLKYETPELTQDELACLLPAYIEAQTGPKEQAIGGKTYPAEEALKKEYAEILEKAQKVINDALTERTGMLWLNSRGINTKNVVFYPPTGRFCLGWLYKLDPVTLPAWRAKLEGFPYPLDLNTANGEVQLVEEEKP